MVTSDLGGGDNGHLGLVCITTEYANANLVGYVCLTHRGKLEIEDNAKQHTATRMREMSKEDV